MSLLLQYYFKLILLESARFWGDEFTILLENIPQVSQAIEVAQLLLNSLIVPFRLDESEIFISAAIAIVLGSPDYQKTGLLRDADTAMYRAKALG